MWFSSALTASRRGADDERGGEADRAGRGVRVAHAGEQRLVGGPADLGAGLVHGGEAGRDEPREVHVVEAGEQDVFASALSPDGSIPVAAGLYGSVGEAPAKMCASACTTYRPQPGCGHDTRYKIYSDMGKSYKPA